MGCFLEFLYTGDYFPKKVPGQRTLEKDPSIPDVDLTGDQLLKHAKVYTLAEKFGLVHLKNLASSKIHCVNSTAKGEIAYARYVYEFTARDDTAIRVPVANFWATRSHTLRAEAEEEFRGLCLEFPQFGYDVLSKFNPCLFERACSCSGSADRPTSLQPAFSTRSSSASATKRCTPAPPRAAPASGPGTAAAPLRKSGGARKSEKPRVFRFGSWVSVLGQSAGAERPRWRRSCPLPTEESIGFSLPRAALARLSQELELYTAIFRVYFFLMFVVFSCCSGRLFHGHSGRREFGLEAAGTLEVDTAVSLQGLRRHTQKA